MSVREEGKKREVVMGSFKAELKRKTYFIIMIFIFPYTWTAVVLNISYFCEITISSQIRHFTDDRLLQKQYVPEPVFLSGW